MHLQSARQAIENDPLLKEVMREILTIQPRFPAEPVLAITGKGFLKSEGVSELQKIKVSEFKNRFQSSP